MKKTRKEIEGTEAANKSGENGQEQKGKFQCRLHNNCHHIALRRVMTKIISLYISLSLKKQQSSI